jgi:hypothetical protein
MSENPEALFSASVKMRDPSGAEWIITMRDEQVPGDKTAEKIENCGLLSRYLVAQGWHPVGNGWHSDNGHKQKSQPAAQPSAPTALPLPTPPSAPPAEVSVEEIDLVKVTAPSGKPQVEFWRAGRKYPELKWNLGGAALLLVAPTLAGAGWTATHFDTIGAEYPLALRVSWTQSPKNPKWKDVVSVELVQ